MTMIRKALAAVALAIVTAAFGAPAFAQSIMPLPPSDQGVSPAFPRGGGERNSN